jgi:hypothetical protein
MCGPPMYLSMHGKLASSKGWRSIYKTSIYGSLHESIYKISTAMANFTQKFMSYTGNVDEQPHDNKTGKIWYI